jgi:hypothetical protein
VPVVAAGSDFMVSTLLHVYLLSLFENLELFRHTVFTFYLLPIGGPGLLAAYVAAQDPVYRVMVNSVYAVVSQTAPIMAEDGGVSVMSIGDLAPRSQHPWFAAPSPASLFQFALQHYLLFAREALPVRVWGAQLHIESQMVTVPFIASLQIRTGDVPALSTFEVSRTLVGSNQSQQLTLRLTGITIWNVNRELGIAPQDPYLIMQSMLPAREGKGEAKSSAKAEPKPSGKGEAKSSSKESLKAAGKAEAKPATKGEGKAAEKVSIETVKDVAIRWEDALFITIDGRRYSGVTSMIVQPFEDPLDAEQQLSLRIATFTHIPY